MGLEAPCRARWNGAVSEGKAHLEAEDLLFRGDFRVKVALKDVKSVEARRGELHVTTAGGELRLELGNAAEQWALKIRYPRSRIDKLGVKPGMRISVLGVADPDFRKELEARTPDAGKGRLRKDSEIVFFAAEDRKSLEKLPAAVAAITQDGAIWIVYPKGRKEITQMDVMSASKAAGLVDTKICSFSPTHSALKTVIPVARRVRE